MSPRAAAKPKDDPLAGLELTPCTGCQKRILWVVINDKPVPLDVVPAVYRVFPPRAGHPEVAERAGQRATDSYIGPFYFVGHHATCPKVGDFSRRSKP